MISEIQYLVLIQCSAGESEGIRSFAVLHSNLPLTFLHALSEGAAHRVKRLRSEHKSILPQVKTDLLQNFRSIFFQSMVYL